MPDKLSIEELSVAPKKTDVVVEQLVLAWVPFVIQPDGRTTSGV